MHVQVENVHDNLEKDYPLLYAVARCSALIERHRPVVTRLEYKGEGDVKETLLFAGKVPTV